jgi:hypothetical protein
MPPTPEQRTEIEEKLQKTVERRLAGERLELSWGDTMSALDAVTMVADEVNAIRAQLENLTPAPSIAPTDDDVTAIFNRLPMTANTVDAGAREWTFADLIVLRCDFSTGEWMVTLRP